MEKLVHQHVLDTLNSVHKAEHELLRSSRKLLSSLNDGEKGYYLYIKNSLEKVMLSDDFDRQIDKLSGNASRNGPLLCCRLAKQDVTWTYLFKALNSKQADINFGINAMSKSDLPDETRSITDDHRKMTVGSLFDEMKKVQCNYFMHVQTLAKLHPKLTRFYFGLTDQALDSLLKIEPISFFMLSKIVLFPRYIELSSTVKVKGGSMSLNKKAWVWAYDLLADTIDEEKLRVNLLELLKVA